MKLAPLFNTFNQYAFAANAFNPAAKAISRIFGLNVLEEPDFWSKTVMDTEPAALVTSLRSVSFALEYLPALTKVLQQEASTRGTARDGTPPEALLTLILPEAPHQHSKPERIAEAINGVTNLYEAIALLESAPENTLTVLSCDSGSDKSFDFLGAAKVMQGVKDLVLALWDRVVFYREAKISQRLELIAESLPILAKIAELEKNESLGREQAELIRRRVLEGATQFVSSRSTIPEMGQRSQFDPRQLMAPEPKLLTSGDTKTTETDSKPTRRRAKQAATAGE